MQQHWDEIKEFISPQEYSRFLTWISEATIGGDLVEVPVGSRYAGSSIFEERWYRDLSGQIWRLVAPEYPFKGVFEKVDDEE